MPSNYHVKLDKKTGIKCKASALSVGDVFTVAADGPIFLCRGVKSDAFSSVMGAERFLTEQTYGIELNKEVTVFPKVTITIKRY